MLSNDCIRQINELFYNSVNNKDMSNQDMATLRAMQKGLDSLIEHKRETEFKERVNKVKEELTKLAKDFPTMAIYLDVEVEGMEEEKNILNYLDAWRWEK